MYTVSISPLLLLVFFFSWLAEGVLCARALRLTDPIHMRPGLTCNPSLLTIDNLHDAAQNQEDVWSQAQQQQLETALARYPMGMDKNERWASISAAVPGKSKKQCVERFKFVKTQLLAKKKAEKKAAEAAAANGGAASPPPAPAQKK